MEPRPPVRPRTRRLARRVIAFLPLLALSCASAPPRVPLLPLVQSPAGAPAAAHPAGYEFFARPRPHDPWTLRIARWQMRQEAARRAGLVPEFPAPPAAAAPVAAGSRSAGARAGGSLAARYDDFMSERRREIVRQVLAWVQAEAEARFVADGPVDHWPTLPEVLANDGDDCDGLELLAYHALRQLGFPEDRVYRAILRHAGSSGHHMVTLWFEDARDPWVIDPTATITRQLLRISEIRGWVPLKVFSETREFTVSAR